MAVGRRRALSQRFSQEAQESALELSLCGGFALEGTLHNAVKSR